MEKFYDERKSSGKKNVDSDSLTFDNSKQSPGSRIRPAARGR